MLEKGGIFREYIPWSSPIVTMPKKAQPGEVPQKCLCINYCTLSSLISPVVEAHPKAQGVFL